MYSRKKLNEIKPYLLTDDVIIIHGARQTGKTTLLKMLMKAYPDKEVCFFDLEDGRLLEVCEQGAKAVVEYLKQNNGFKNQERFFLFVDEIQYLKNPSSFLKIMHDHYTQIKLIVSGSSSFEIKSKFKDTLVGRTVNFELFPLDFEEFLIFKKKKYDLSMEITLPLLHDELNKLYREYVAFGGYPKIVLADSIEKKERYLQQIIDTYIKQDIRDLANIRNIDKFNRLLHVLASQSGQLLNVVELSNTTGLSRQTIEEYLFILENTYIIKLLNPFSRNVRSELFKRQKIFFYDTGLLNILWLKTLPPEITGGAYKTSVFSEFIKNYGRENIRFWRTQDKKEIDFIVMNRNEPVPVEVKINAASIKFTPIRYFDRKYKPEKKFCISLEGELPVKKDFKLDNIRPWEYKRVFEI